ncbi:MAG: dioxygenase [Blastopirellula sp.]|nr:MAG: dioxygenase [Blastopirellula sp.]
MSVKRQPAFYLSHGGGPCFWIETPPPYGPHAYDDLRHYFEGMLASLPERPKAIVVISGHWEAKNFTVSANPAPGMLFDYYGFPAHTYELSYPAKGDPVIAGRISELLAKAGISHETDTERGFDHGVFVPMLIVDPDGNIPVVMMSIREDFDPATHIAFGEALAPLRDEGVVIIGSGSSYHNMTSFGDGKPQNARVFDTWLRGAVTQSEYGARKAALLEWDQAPMARDAQPREDHLIPLMAVVGAGGADPAIVDFQGDMSGKAISGFRIG